MGKLKTVLDLNLGRIARLTGIASERIKGRSGYERKSQDYRY